MTMWENRETLSTCPGYTIGDACVFLYEYDRDVEPIARVETFVAAERLCSRHAGLPPAQAFAIARDENYRVSFLFQILRTIKPALTNEQFRYSYSLGGLLMTAVGSALTTQQKNQAQAFADIQFGPNKVLVA